MNIELIPNSWDKYPDVPTPVIVICPSCCENEGYREGGKYNGDFIRYPFYGEIGSMNVVNKSNNRKCISCKTEV